jgi:hypothetical protein
VAFASPSMQTCVSVTVTEPFVSCDYMCNYCAFTLGTNNFVFPDGVCTVFPTGGCDGRPVEGKTYQCCSVALAKEEKEEL